MRWLLLLAITACGSPRSALADAGDAAPMPDVERTSFTPSNQVDATLLASVSMPIVIASDTTFDTDSGVISGGLTRIAGPNVESGVGFLHKSADNGARIGVFYVHDLHITGGTIRFTGHRAVGFFVGHSMTLDVGAVIDGSALGDDSGPGGSPFFTGPTPGPTACEGGPGTTGPQSDGGGGGGGGSTTGGDGGSGDQEPGGGGGVACLTTDLQPLRGGGTGGVGGLGAAAVSALGGGGGGGIQITALGTIAIDGTIVMAGGGGGGGPLPLAGNNAAAGAGGGAGGGILLEGLSIAITGVLAANGGGGGGGGVSNAAGTDGDPGTTTTAAATGGAGGGGGSTAGGNGGARASTATAASDATQDGGGGGGAAGVIFLRALGSPTLTDAVISPEPGTGTVTAN